MTLIRRDVNVIYDASKYLQEENKNLVLAKTKIITDLDNLFSKYQGIDAKIINVNFFEAVNHLDSLIERVDYYSKYMNGVVNHDQENIQNATKALTAILASAPTSNNYASTSVSNSFSFGKDSTYVNVTLKDKVPLAQDKTYIGNVDKDSTYGNVTLKDKVPLAQDKTYIGKVDNNR